MQCTHSYAALWLLCQTNLPSWVARRPLSQTISRLLPNNQEQMRPPLPREISWLTSHGRINATGSVCTSVHILMFETKSNYIQDSFLHTRNCYFSFLKAAEENVILKAILTNSEKRFSVTYDTSDYKVTEVELKWTVLVQLQLHSLFISFHFIRTTTGHHSSVFLPVLCLGKSTFFLPDKWQPSTNRVDGSLGWKFSLFHFPSHGETGALVIEP